MIKGIPYFCVHSDIINKSSFPNKAAFLSELRLYLYIVTPSYKPLFQIKGNYNTLVKKYLRWPPAVREASFYPGWWR